MAINEENDLSQTTVKAEPLGAQPAQAQQRKGDFTQVLRNLGGGLVAAGAGGEYFTKFRNHVVEIARSLLSDSLTLTTISLNRQEHENLRFSAIVLALQHKEIKGVVSYHTLILEATGEELKPQMCLIDNQQVRVNYVTSDTNDAILSDLAYREVTRNFRDANTVLTAAAQVVPSSVSVENASSIEPIVREASLASLSAILSATDNFDRLSLEDISRDTRLVLDMVTGTPVVYDTVGNPLRASVQVAVSTQKKDGKTNDPTIVNTPNSTLKFCDLTGFVNPIWAPIQQQSTAFGYLAQQQPIPVGKLAAEFVITGIRTPYATSPAAVILALSSVLMVTDNNNWVQSLIPKSFGNSNNELTDVGGLNVICNIANETKNGSYGTPIDTSTLANDPIKFNQCISQLFRPGTIVSIDCPEATPQSWYLNVFAAAAMGDNNAIAQIIDAANELTGNRFSANFHTGAPLFSNQVRVPLGYYIQNGQKRDIRDVDLTVVCNAFKTNPDNIHQYNDTFVPRPQSGPVVNLAKREGIIGHILRDQFKITGYALRCTFSKDFIEALSKSFATMHLNTTLNTPLSVDQLRNGTPAPDFVSNAMVGATQTYFSQSGFAGPRGFSNGSMFGGGFRR